MINLPRIKKISKHLIFRLFQHSASSLASFLQQRLTLHLHLCSSAPLGTFALVLQTYLDLFSSNSSVKQVSLPVFANVNEFYFFGFWSPLLCLNLLVKLTSTVADTSFSQQFSSFISWLPLEFMSLFNLVFPFVFLSLSPVLLAEN